MKFVKLMNGSNFYRMRNLKIIALLGMLLCTLLTAEAKELVYWVDVFQYTTPTGQPYLEVHTHIQAHSLQYVASEKGEFVASADLMLFLQDATKEAEANAIRVSIQSPALADTQNAVQNLILTDVRKLVANPGKNIIMGVILDANLAEEKELRFEREAWFEKENTFSDILFIDEFAKSDDKENRFFRYGFSVVPRMGANLFDQDSTLSFYVEMYNLNNSMTGKNYFLTSYVTEKSSDNKLPGLTKTTRRNLNSLDVYSHSFDISLLPHGAYYLNLDVYDGKNKLIHSKSTEFLVRNEKTGDYLPYDYSRFDELFAVTEPEVDFYFRPMKYIATPAEQDSIKHLGDFESKKHFFYTFWDKRKEKEHDNPAGGFYDFKARVEFVNDRYKSSYLAGWRTDRGRVFIQNGPPNNIDPFPGQSNGRPHEIWTYNKLNTQANVTFVFVDWDLNTGDYNLVHSTKRGEVANTAWRLQTIR